MDLTTRQGRHEQGQLIQRAVERAGLSVEELANRIGCSRALIYQYLSGTTLAQPDRLQRIAAETGVSLAYFYGATEEGQDERRLGEIDKPQPRFIERMRQLEELAQAQEAPPDWSRLASTCERIISLASQIEDEATEARAWLRLGKARIHMGDFHRATDALRRAASSFKARGEIKAEGEARQALGHALLASGRTPEAREQFAWVAQSEGWESRWSGAVSLAAVFEQLGDFRRAIEYCDEAAAVLDEGRDAREIANGMLYVNANRVNVYLACGDFQSAAGLSERCLEDAEALGNSGQHIEARLNMGVCGLWQGRWAAAHRTLSTALQLSRFIGDKSREAISRATLASLLAAIGDCDNCLQQAKDALAMALSHADRRAELFAQMALADAYADSDRDGEARYHANQALGVATTLRSPLYEAECRLRIARLCLKMRDPGEAAADLERAMSVAAKLGARHIETMALLLRGQLRLEAGRLDAAEHDIWAARERASDLRMNPALWTAEGLAARVACAYDPPRREEAREAVGRAVALIERERAELREAGIPDAILEQRERQDIYLLYAQLLVDTGRLEEAEAFVEQADWPPLTARRRET